MNTASSSPTESGQGDASHKVARQSVQELYLQKTLEAVRTFDWVLSNLEGTTDRRPKYMARQILNRILDDGIRHELLREFDKKLAEINASGKNNETKSDEIIQLSIDVVGEAVSYLDEYLNVHKLNTLGDA